MKKAGEYIHFTGAATLIAGLCFSPAMLSIGMVLMVVGALAYSPLQTINSFKNSPYFWLWSLVFLHSLFAGLYSENTNGWLADVTMKIPFLVLPLALANPMLVNSKKLNLWLLLFTLVVFIAGFSTFVHFLLNFQEVMDRLRHFQPVEIFTSINHIYYSIMLGFSVFTGFYLLYRKIFPQKGIKILLIAILIFNIGFLHLLAARTGLMAFYVALAGSGLIFLLARKKFKQALIFYGGMALFALGVYFAVEPIQSRVQHTITDISTFFYGGDINDWSVSMRLAAWEVSWQVFRENPLLGTSPADLQHNMFLAYDDYLRLDPLHRKMPHNQFLQFLTGKGLTGLSIFLLAFFYPLFQGKWKSFLFLNLFMVSASAMMVESILERQLGIAFFLFFWLVLGHTVNGSKAEKNDSLPTQ